MTEITRRKFLGQAGLLSGAAMGLPSLALSNLTEPVFPKGKAEFCIFLWLGGGMCHIDTWDPKKRSTPKVQVGSHYASIDTAVDGVQVCEHLPQSARILDQMTIVRSMSHNVVDEHAAAVYRLHTGRETSDTVLYPSIGSIVAHERGSAATGVPPYVVIGYPNIARAPGFLGAKSGYVYITDTESGPKGLTRPKNIPALRHQRREALLSELKSDYLANHQGDTFFSDYASAMDQSIDLSGPQFMRVFNLAEEKDSLRNAYGGEFGQRCLLSRRLIQSGVRFVEVTHNLNFINGTGWDTHNEGQLKQHILIQELDEALSTLVADLKEHDLLDRTLICAATEFGRPPDYDAGGGRGHHAKAFSVVLAGGGLNHRGTFGSTDEVGEEVVTDLCSVPDLHATIHAALGINPAKHLYAGERPVPITDYGRPIAPLFG